MNSESLSRATRTIRHHIGAASGEILPAGPVPLIQTGACCHMSSKGWKAHCIMIWYTFMIAHTISLLKGSQRYWLPASPELHTTVSSSAPWWSRRWWDLSQHKLPTQLANQLNWRIGILMDLILFYHILLGFKPIQPDKCQYMLTLFVRHSCCFRMLLDPRTMQSTHTFRNSPLSHMPRRKATDQEVVVAPGENGQKYVGRHLGYIIMLAGRKW